MGLINTDPETTKSEHTTVRHLKAKLAQRIGMTYLRVIIERKNFFWGNY